MKRCKAGKKGRIMERAKERTTDVAEIGGMPCRV